MRYILVIQASNQWGSKSTTHEDSNIGIRVCMAYESEGRAALNQESTSLEND